MFRALILASLVVAASLGVLELSARTANNFSAEGFGGDRIASDAQLSIESPLLSPIPR